MRDIDFRFFAYCSLVFSILWHITFISLHCLLFSLRIFENLTDFLDFSPQMDFSVTERAKLAIWYDVFGSVVEVQRKFRVEFNDRNRVPSKDLILASHERLLTTGSVLPKARGPDAGVPARPCRTNSTEQRVLEAYQRSPEKSLRRGEDELGLSKSTIHRILQANKLKPYKVQILQALNEEDVDRRLEFAEQQLKAIENDPDYLDKIVFSDEAIFALSGHVNKQNCRYWSDENPHFFTEAPLNSPKVMVYAGIWRGGIIGPYFFDTTVTGDNYLEMLKAFVLPRLQNHPRFRSLLFMQDGAPPHFARTVRQWLDENFPDRWIGRRGPIEWPPRSPDLTPCDFFLWGYLKSQVYAHKPSTSDELKTLIARSIHEIQQDVIDRSLLEYRKRLHKCMEAGGGHVENC